MAPKRKCWGWWSLGKEHSSGEATNMLGLVLITAHSAVTFTGPSQMGTATSSETSVSGLVLELM